MSDLRFISADSHVQESDEFKMRVPAQFRERLPHTEVINGGEYQIVEGRKPRRYDIAESRVDEDDMNREWRDDPTEGRDIKRRLEDQDRDTVTAEVIYCNDLLTYLGSPDTEFQMTVAQTYNDWIHELFGSRPDRLAPAAILPTLDVPAAVKEAYRLAELGFKLVSSPIGIKNQPYNRKVYEPLWKALEETGLVFSLHFNTGTEDHLPDKAGEEDDDNGFLPYMIISMAEGYRASFPYAGIRGADAVPGAGLRGGGVRGGVVGVGAVCAGRAVPAEAHVGRAEAGVEPERLF